MKGQVYRFPLHVDTTTAQQRVAEVERQVAPRVRKWRWKRRAMDILWLGVCALVVGGFTLLAIGLWEMATLRGGWVR